MTTSQIPATNAEDKLDFKKLLPIFLVVLIDLLGLTIIIPLLPLYAASFNANAATIGWLGASYPIMQFIGAPVLGRLSDRFGRKPILLISQCGTLIGFLLLGFAGSLPILFLARIVDGLSGANISTAQAVITDSTNEKTRTQALGLLGAAFGLGFIIGPVIAAVSLGLSGNNYHVPAFVAAVFSALSIILTMTRLEETHKPGTDTVTKAQSAFSIQGVFHIISSPTIALLLALMFFQQIAFGGFEQLLSLFTLTRLGLNAAGNALIFVYVGIVVVMVQGYFIGKWSRRFGDRKLIFLGLAMLLIGLGLMAFTPKQTAPWYTKAEMQVELSHGQIRPGETPPVQSTGIELPVDTNSGWTGIIWILIAMIPTAIGGGILQPSINSLLTKQVPKAEIGGTLGLSAAFLSGSNAIAPLLGGWLFQTFGNGAPFIVWAVIMGILLIFALVMIKPVNGTSATIGGVSTPAPVH